MIKVCHKLQNACSGGSKGGGVRDARPPLCVQILSISCSFWENLAKLRVHAPPLGGFTPPLGEILDPSLACVSVQQMHHTGAVNFCKFRPLPTHVTLFRSQRLMKMIDSSKLETYICIFPKYQLVGE